MRSTPSRSAHPAPRRVAGLVARRLAPALLAPALLAAALAAPAARAAPDDFLYAVNEFGKVSVNGIKIESLPGGFDVDETTFGATIIEDADDRWWDLFVKGPDRYLVRRNGLVHKNGARLAKLPKKDGEPWTALAVTDDDNTWYALRRDGRLDRDGAPYTDRPVGDLAFIDLVTDGAHVYALKTNGLVFRDDETDALVDLDGPGPDGTGGAQWRRLAFHPLDGRLFGLRRDGHVASAALGADGGGAAPSDGGAPPTGTLEVDLPGDGDEETEQRFVGFSFAPDGTWYAIRGDGRLYDTTHTEPALVNLPGSGNSHNYVDVLAAGARVFALRGDGRLFEVSDPVPLVNMAKKRYRALASSTAAPDLTEARNRRPVVTTYRVQAVVGEPLVVPVIASDVDKPSAELIVTPDLDTLPPGATWNAGARQLEWPSPGPAGNYTFVVTADDGVTKPARGRFRIAVRPPHEGPGNVAPGAAKIRHARLFLGLDLTLPILVSDRDGDPLTVSVDESKTPLPQGASFDPDTNVFTWSDPLLQDVGKHRIVFLVDDGTVVRRRAVRVQVLASLLAL